MSEPDPEVTPPDEAQDEVNDQPDEPEEAAEKPRAKKAAAKKTSKRSSSSTSTDNYTSGEVDPSDLRMGTRDSDSVRRLQTALGTNVTGNYDKGTQLAVRSWQKRNGFEGGRGIQVGEVQARRLFGSGDYTII